MLCTKCHFMQDTANPAKSGSAVATSRLCSAAAILIFSFWSLVENCCLGMWRTCGFSAQNYCKLLELADVAVAPMKSLSTPVRAAEPIAVIVRDNFVLTYKGLDGMANL
jgi:hypothetical protein